MDQYKTDVRMKETSELLRLVDEVLLQRQRYDFGNALHGNELEQLWREIDRARRQFDSKLFFIVVFGPLKAGKSTLTNALAGEYVSPAGFGKETTRRPSLVIRGEASGIDQYFSTDPEVNQLLSQRRVKGEAGSVSTEEDAAKMATVRDTFDMVADYLRGITRNDDKFQGRIRIAQRPLTVPNLEETLTQDLPTEPLFTVIRCKGGHLLNHEVAIVDMPGLDGSKSNWRDDPIHEWVIQRAEFFLFVQSSVAALNRETRDFVQQVLSQSTNPPIWLIQNTFDARHWQPEEKRRKDEEAQREEGKLRVTDLLDRAPRSVLPLNLGLAWDGTSEACAEWLSRSGFPKFEQELAEVLHAERGLIQERNSGINLRQRIAKAKETLTRIAQQITEVRTNHERVRGALNRAMSFLDAVNYQSDWESAVGGEIRDMAAESRELWSKSLENECDKLSVYHDQTRTGKEVNDALGLVATKLAAEGASKHFTRSLILSRYIRLANQFCKSAENDSASRCNELLNELKLARLPEAIPPTIDNLPSMKHDAFPKGDLQEKRRLLYMNLNSWIDKAYNGATNKAHIEKVRAQWKQQIETRSDVWATELLNNHFSTYCEKRRAHFQAHIQRLSTDFEANSKPELEAVAATESLIQKTNAALATLQIPLDNAVASMK